MRGNFDFLRRVISNCRQDWRSLVLTDLAYKALAIILLLPLVGVLFRSLLALSGKTVLADFDLLDYFLGPAGWVCAVAVGALWVSVMALEQSSMLGVLAASGQGQRLQLVGALRLVNRRKMSVLRLSFRLVATSLLLAAPFLAAGGVIYGTLLTRFDINFYLTEKPPVFWLASGLIALDLLAMVVVQLRFLANRFLALPIGVLENLDPASALRSSRQRVVGMRMNISFWLIGWLVLSLVGPAVLLAAINGAGRAFLTEFTGSVSMLVLAMGGLVVTWVIGSLTINVASTVFFAAMLFQFYLSSGNTGAYSDDLAFNVGDESTKPTRLRITGRRLAVALVSGIVISAITGVSFLRSFDIDDRTLVAAHRGGAADAPENTLAAIELAIVHGADFVEIDVQETADSVVVVIHDSDLKKIAGVDLKVWDATMQDLATIDIGSRFDPAFKDQRVPTLDQVLQLCRDRVRVIIELKYYGHNVSLEQKVVDLVESNGMESQIVVMSLKSEGLQKMKRLRPAWIYGLLSATAIGDLTKTEFDFLAVNGGMATREFIRSAHNAGKDVYVWTVNDALTMSQMIGRGADCLITDQPKLGKSILVQRDQMSPLERLTSEVSSFFGLRPKFAEQ